MDRKTKILLLLDTLVSSFLAGFFPELLEKYGIGFPAKHYITLMILAIFPIIFLILDERGKDA